MRGIQGLLAAILGGDGTGSYGDPFIRDIGAAFPAAGLRAIEART